MLQSGRAPLKVTWDVDAKRLRFDAPLPHQIIVPTTAMDFEDADWCVHVLTMSVEKYKNNPNYNQDEEYIKSITGRPGAHGASNRDASYIATKDSREGITVAAGAKEILLWERYQRVDTGKTDELRRPIKKWQIRTYAPVKPEEDSRPPQWLPYDHGMLPFVSFAYEVKDKGFYSPRGIVELVGSFQTYLAKLWNTKSDYLALTTAPVFNGKSDTIQNGSNLAISPGKVFEGDFTAIVFPPPPMSLDEEMSQVRAIAEYRVGTPDFGLAGRRDGGKGGVTATEVDRIGEVMSQSQDIRARIFRLSMGKMFKQAWSLLVQYDKGLRNFMDNTGAQTLPEEAMHLEYDIKPNGSPDSWNRTAQMQKAAAVLQSATGNPNANAAEAYKYFLEQLDPQIVPRIFVEPQNVSGRQEEEQAEEIVLMKNGFPAEIYPADDDIVHIQTCLQYAQNEMQDIASGQGMPPTVKFATLLLAHLMAHTKQATEKNLKQDLAPLMQPLNALEKMLTVLILSGNSGPVQPPVPSQMQPPLGPGQLPASQPGQPMAPGVSAGAARPSPHPHRMPMALVQKAPSKQALGAPTNFNGTPPPSMMPSL